MNFLIIIFQGLKMLTLGIRFKIFMNPNGEKAAKYLESLGPIFIKFGQLLSTRTDILDIDTAKELQSLTDSCKPFSVKELKKIVEKELGNSINDLFDDFNEVPMAAASLAQVHSAKLQDGKKIVVKVLRPNIEKEVKKNLRLLKSAAKVCTYLYSESDRIRPVEVVKDYENTILRELDLRLEAANTNLTRKNFAGSEELYIPEVYWDLTTSKVMVLEEIDGIPCTDIETIEKFNIDKKRLAENGVMIFLNQVFRDNFFHADMHPGNIFVSKENPEKPGYIAIDCAISGSLSNDERYILARMLQAVIKQNYKSLAQLFISSEWVNPNSNQIELENTLRACCEPIFEKPLSEIEFGKLLLYLFQSTRPFGLSLQPSLVLLQKTLIHIEGMGRQIYPQLDFWSIAKPFLQEWTKDRYNPKKIEAWARKNAGLWLEKARKLPEVAENVLDQINKIEDYQKDNEIRHEELITTIKREKRGTRVLIFISLVVLIFLFLPWTIN